MKFSRPSKMDWMFCKMDRGMFSICSFLGCPLFVYSLVLYIRNIAKCILQTWCILVETIVQLSQTFRPSKYNGLMLCCLFSSVTNGILSIFCFTLRRLSSSNSQKGKWSNHLSSFCLMPHISSQSKQDFMLILMDWMIQETRKYRLGTDLSTPTVLLHT